jgi:hypothetical protein
VLPFHNFLYNKFLFILIFNFRVFLHSNKCLSECSSNNNIIVIIITPRSSHLLRLRILHLILSLISFPLHSMLQHTYSYIIHSQMWIAKRGMNEEENEPQSDWKSIFAGKLYWRSCGTLTHTHSHYYLSDIIVEYW